MPVAIGRWNLWGTPMTTRSELKINARGLSVPGPRMMVEAALERHPNRFLRIVVSSPEAVEDLEDFLAGRAASVTVDQVGGDYHVLVELED